MLQRTEEILAALNTVLDELRSLPPSTLVLVEGSKDERSLRNLGVESPIERIHTSRPLPEVLTGFEEVVVLTDYDRQGGVLARKVEKIARSFGVRPNLDLRRRMRKATHGEISHIEGLDSYVQNLPKRPSVH